MFFLIAAALVAAFAAATDARTGRIPNWLTLGTLGVALVGHTVLAWHVQHSFRSGMEQLAYSVVGALACALVPGFLYARGAIGGGDVKLFAAIGALCHPMIGLEMETYSFVAAFVLAPAKMAYDGVLLKTLGRSLALATNPFRKVENRRELPQEMMTWFRLGPSIFLGTAATVLVHWGMPR